MLQSNSTRGKSLASYVLRSNPVLGEIQMDSQVRQLRTAWVYSHLLVSVLSGNSSPEFGFVVHTNPETERETQSNLPRFT